MVYWLKGIPQRAWIGHALAKFTGKLLVFYLKFSGNNSQNILGIHSYWLVVNGTNEKQCSMPRKKLRLPGTSN